MPTAPTMRTDVRRQATRRRLWRGLYTLAVVGTAVLVVGGVLAARWPVTYTAEAIVEIAAHPSRGRTERAADASSVPPGLDALLAELVEPASLRRALAAVAENRAAAGSRKREEARNVAAAEPLCATLLPGVGQQEYAIRLSWSHRDPQLAAAVVNHVARSIDQRALEPQPRTPSDALTVSEADWAAALSQRATSALAEPLARSDAAWQAVDRALVELTALAESTESAGSNETAGSNDSTASAAPVEQRPGARTSPSGVSGSPPLAGHDLDGPPELGEPPLARADREMPVDPATLPSAERDAVNPFEPLTGAMEPSDETDGPPPLIGRESIQPAGEEGPLLGRERIPLEDEDHADDDLVANPVRAALEREIAQLEARRQKLLTYMTGDHPSVAELDWSIRLAREQLDELPAQVRAETARVETPPAVSVADDSAAVDPRRPWSAMAGQLTETQAAVESYRAAALAERDAWRAVVSASPGRVDAVEHAPADTGFDDRSPAASLLTTAATTSTSASVAASTATSTATEETAAAASSARWFCQWTESARVPLRADESARRFVLAASAVAALALGALAAWFASARSARLVKVEQAAATLSVPIVAVLPGRQPLGVSARWDLSPERAVCWAAETLLVVVVLAWAAAAALDPGFAGWFVSSPLDAVAQWWPV